MIWRLTLFPGSREVELQTNHVYSTLKRRGKGRFQVVSTWNTRGVFVGKVDSMSLGQLISYSLLFQGSYKQI